MICINNSFFIMCTQVALSIRKSSRIKAVLLDDSEILTHNIQKSSFNRVSAIFNRLINLFILYDC